MKQKQRRKAKVSNMFVPLAKSLRTGQVDHRRACGNRFQVWDAQVVAKGYVYICPACKGNVASDVKTGKIDHRTVCGNQFSVKDGAVKEKAYVYICPACKGMWPVT